MEKSYESEGSAQMVEMSELSPESLVQYKNRSVPKRKEYRLERIVCNKEVKEFIKILEKKFKESSVKILESRENSYKILIEGKGLEDPSCKINIKLQEKGQNSTEITLELDFKPYYKRVFTTGLIGVLFVFIVLSVSVGSLSIQNLVSLGYILGSIGLVAISVLILGIFGWNRSLAFHSSALEALYRRLDALEREFIDQALQNFREKAVKEIPKEKGEICFYCDAPLPAVKKLKVIQCEVCHHLTLNCSICLLNINHKEPILICPHCNSPAHRDHFREWLKIKSFCPYCKQKIEEKELEDKMEGAR